MKHILTFVYFTKKTRKNKADEIGNEKYCKHRG